MGLFITFEGGDGCGKTSVIKGVIERLKTDGYDIVYTREPGGSAIAEKIRNIILDVENVGMEYMTESLLYAACRSQHLHDIIIPSLKDNKIVICDRFVDSSYVYQGIARNIGLQDIMEINNLVVKDHMPDITIFIDVSVETALTRMQTRGEKDRLDLESIEFHHKVRNGYHQICEMFKDRIVTVNGENPLEDVINEAYTKVKEFIRSHN